MEWHDWCARVEGVWVCRGDTGVRNVGVLAADGGWALPSDGPWETRQKYDDGRRRGVKGRWEGCGEHGHGRTSRRRKDQDLAGERRNWSTTKDSELVAEAIDGCQEVHPAMH